MRFMIIVKSSPEIETRSGVIADDQVFAAMADYHEELARAGALLDASGLQPTVRGWRVRYAGGRRQLIDGPFAESKELVAGYTIIQARSREEAREWTRRFPNPAGEGQDAEIEVRQLFEIDEFPPDDATDRFRQMGMGG